MTTLLCLSLLAIFALPASASPPPDLVPTAVRRGLSRLEKGSGSYITKRDCFSCHHQTHTIGAFVSAKRRGFTISEKVLKEQIEFTLATFSNKRDKLVKGDA